MQNDVYFRFEKKTIAIDVNVHYKSELLMSLNITANLFHSLNLVIV